MVLRWLTVIDIVVEPKVKGSNPCRGGGQSLTDVEVAILILHSALDYLPSLENQASPHPLRSFV